jgi:hypothetical protein
MLVSVVYKYGFWYSYTLSTTGFEIAAYDSRK